MAIELLFERMPGKAEVADAMGLGVDSAIPSWGLGRSYASLQDQGYGQRAIATAIGRSQQHVSMCVTIFRGICPAAYEKLCRLGSAGPDVLGLARIARLRKDDEPDEEGQLGAIEKIVRKRKIPRDFNLERVVFRQFLRLREMRMPDQVSLTSVLMYLSGDPVSWPSTTATRRARPLPTSRSRSTDSTGRRTPSGSSTRGGSRRS
jgi:hypothetical protein